MRKQELSLSPSASYPDNLKAPVNPDVVMREVVAGCHEKYRQSEAEYCFSLIPGQVLRCSGDRTGMRTVIKCRERYHWDPARAKTERRAVNTRRGETGL